MNFVVDDKHFLATIDKMEGGKIMESLLVSNYPYKSTTIIPFSKSYGKMELMWYKELEISKMAFIWQILRYFIAFLEHGKYIWAL
jgi:hypothetical protein